MTCAQKRYFYIVYVDSVLSDCVVVVVVVVVVPLAVAVVAAMYCAESNFDMPQHVIFFSPNEWYKTAATVR